MEFSSGTDIAYSLTKTNIFSYEKASPKTHMKQVLGLANRSI
jgi:hypothetical protein